jgi:Pyruvate/2-oxoacid:ferredoxin oxidoreductase delta subunit
MDFSSFAEGPLLWSVFLIFLSGIIGKLSFFVYAIIKNSKDHNSRWRYIFATLGRSFVPFNCAVIYKPIYTTLRYIFHLCMILVPIFLAGHIMLWEESRFESSWAALPDAWADWMTLIFIALASYFLIRRIVVKDIRLTSTASDYLLIIIATLPFISGYFLSHTSLQSFTFLADSMRIFHVLSAEALMLLAVFLFCRIQLNKAKCIGCASCVLSCPTNTLESTDKGKQRIFSFAPYQCICCGACANICPEEAAELRHEISPKQLFLPSFKQKIHVVELTACERCGELVAPQLQVEKIGKTISNKYLSLCIRCKGIVMFREI